MLRAITGLSTLLAVLLFGAVPAVAHGGKIKLEVAGDGATGVTVRALYENDSHPVEDKVLRLTLTATGEGGKTVGPVDVPPAGEGRSFYTSPGVLTPGRWTVAVSSTDPGVTRAESTVEARTAQLAPTASPRASAASASADRAGSGGSGGSQGEGRGNGGGTWWSVAFAVALGLTAFVVIRTRRRR
jgi:hypothetical protein